MDEDIKNAISTEDPILHSIIIKALSAVGTVAGICIKYEEGEISGKTAMDVITKIICDLESTCMKP